MSTVKTEQQVAALIAKARQVRPSAAQLEQVEHMLGSAVAPLPAGPEVLGQVASTAAAGAGHTVASMWVAKIGIVLAVGGGAAAGATWLVHSEPMSVRPVSVPSVASGSRTPNAVAASAPAAVESVAEPPVPSEVVSEPAAEPSSGVSQAQSERSSGRTEWLASAAASSEAWRTEALIVDRARAMVSRDARRALVLLSQHRRQFPNGKLAPEREVLEIEALGRLGRNKEAQQRADAFEKSNPGSALQPRVNSLVGRGGIAVPK